MSSNQEPEVVVVTGVAGGPGVATRPSPALKLRQEQPA